MCFVALLAGLSTAAPPLVQAAVEASSQDTAPISRRQLLQNIDPLSNPLRTTMCVKDTTVLPYSAVGIIVSNASQDVQACMAVLIASDAVLTSGICLDPSKSAHFNLGGSQCSEKTDKFRSIDVTNIFKPNTASNCGIEYNASCRQQYNYAVAKLAEKLPNYLSLASEDTTVDTTVNIAGWAGARILLV